MATAWYTAPQTSWNTTQTGTEWNSSSVAWNAIDVAWNAIDDAASWKSDSNTAWNNNNIFVDDFVTDGWLVDNGKGWTDAGLAFPDDFSRIKTLNGNAYVEPDVTIPANCDLNIVNQYGGTYSITCGYIDTGLEDIEITTVWRGDPVGVYPSHTAEAGPLACITESSSKFGFGLWPSLYLGIGLGLIGWIGKPGTLFSVPYVLFYQRSTEPRTVKMTVINYQCRFYIDGIEHQAYSNPGLIASDVYIPAELRGSTKHGFCLDQHLDENVTDSLANVRITPANSGETMNMATTGWNTANNTSWQS